MTMEKKINEIFISKIDNIKDMINEDNTFEYDEEEYFYSEVCKIRDEIDCLFEYGIIDNNDKISMYEKTYKLDKMIYDINTGNIHN